MAAARPHRSYEFPVSRISRPTVDVYLILPDDGDGGDGQGELIKRNDIAPNGINVYVTAVRG